MQIRSVKERTVWDKNNATGKISSTGTFSSFLGNSHEFKIYGK
jgi:hypothetical protein